MLRETNNKDLILFTVGPLLGLFLLIILIYIIYKLFLNRRLGEDQISILDNRFNDEEDIRLGNLRFTNDINLFQKVNEQNKKKIKDSRESAYVYLRFFMRSNPEKIYLTIEHLNKIGSQLETEKNWFLVKQLIRTESNEINKFRLISINFIDSKSNSKIKKLIEIADSMSISLNQMEVLIDKFFKSLKHPHILSYDTVNVNFEKNRLLYIQDYSRDGSLRDFLSNTNPNDSWEIKSAKNDKKFLDLKTIKEYGKQILTCLIYLKQNFLIPFDNLHSGNVILAYKKKICLLTGYENSFFLNLTRSDKMNKKYVDKLRKLYLIQEKNNDNNEILIKKAKGELEQKRLIETLRFGFLLCEMCLGSEIDDLIPNENLLSQIKMSYNQRDMNEIEKIFNFIFFNRNGLDADDEKHKKKFLIPSLEQIEAHNFFSTVKLKDYSGSDTLIDPQEIEFFQYLTGKLEIKQRKLRKKSMLDQFSNSKKRLSELKESKFEIQEENDKKDSNKTISLASTATFSAPPPPPTLSGPPLSQLSGGIPPPPAPPLLAGPPPPPLPPTSNPPNLSSLPVDNDSSDRSAFLSDIRKGMKLKKTVTIDKSNPKF
ncbi:unnamed protein product [Brachionus calyciflorus]|uniref:WH2 domain-containing protein n=1 Tax=Brachionus calyciflorus TaxID=104777 RepID=A0A813SJC0_9BILA|nr:unnamed protein product [Brachionus calyciflorus]